MKPVQRHLARVLGTALAMALVVLCPTRVAGGQGAVEMPTGAMFDRYAAGRLTVGALGVDTILPFIAQLHRTAVLWIGPATAPDAGRRRLAVATFALELDAANLDSLWQPGVGNDLIEWACGLLRSGPAMPAERGFYVAGMALLERIHEIRVNVTTNSAGQRVRDNNDAAIKFHAAHAEGRFPGDPQWALSRAVAEELPTWPAPRDEDKLSVAANVESRIRARYRDAMALDTARDEAHLRFGYFELRRGRTAEAMTEFDQVNPSAADPTLRYWLHLFRGRALARMNRTSEAAASFRRAVAEVPGAQSATIALAVMLAADRQTSDGSDLVGQMLLLREPPRDPWTIYEFPTTRHWKMSIETLRGAFVP